MVPLETLCLLLPLKFVEELEELVGHRLPHDFAVDRPQLAANGRLSRTVAKAFLDVGYDVIAVTRTGKPLPELNGARCVSADASNADSLIAATKGAEIIFNGLNPLYTEWEERAVPLARTVIAACKANKIFFLNSFTKDDVIDMIKEGVMIGPASEQAAEIGRKFTKRTMPW